ncbi:MAG: TerD family protein [Synergistaceae bacterium]|jgi:tellurite resistance protein TerA|nr:TerD family protein [Synergistaceae bacterium]
MELARGQKVKLSDALASLRFEVSIDVDSGQTIDISCFGLDGERCLSDDRYFIFYNQKTSPCSSIVQRDKSSFSLNLSNLPSSIKSIVFVVTLDGDGDMSAIGPSSVKVFENGALRLIFPFSGGDFSSEKAIMAVELYFKDTWRFAAIGQGFSGGLSAVLAHFGGSEIPVPPPPSKVSLSKVTLEKRGESKKIDLTKQDSASPIHINLQWDESAREKKGLWSRIAGGKSSAVDLDLGCMYRLKNGSCGVIQPLGSNFGAKSSPPYIFLDKDDRTGAAEDGENMYVFRPNDIDLMVIFAMIYEGTAEFSSVNGRVTLKDGRDFEILVPLNNSDGGKRFCAVARVESDGGSIKITKDELYFPGHRECDNHYGFGFSWKVGKK